MKKTEAGAATAAPGDTLHTLEALEAALGKASLSDAEALFEGYAKAALVKEGSAVATPRISTDAARIYGQAYDFLARATDEQLDLLPAFNKDWLRVAVWTAGEGDRRYGQKAEQASERATRQGAAGAAAEALQRAGEAKRDQLHVALVSLAGGVPELLTAVASAYGTAADVPGSISAQVTLARGWLTKPPGKMAARLKTSRITAAWLAKADEVATGLRGASTAAAATRSATPVSSADVDHVDGLNLLLLRSVIAQFEAAHQSDPAIPRLVFNSLNSHVHRAHHAPRTPPT